jgi:hypothetical protein
MATARKGQCGSPELSGAAHLDGAENGLGEFRRFLCKARAWHHRVLTMVGILITRAAIIPTDFSDDYGYLSSSAGEAELHGPPIL